MLASLPFDGTPKTLAEMEAGLPTVTVEDAAVVVTCFDLTENGMDFADALHLGKSGHCEGLASFDRKFVKAAKAAGYDDVREA